MTKVRISVHRNKHSAMVRLDLLPINIHMFFPFQHKSPKNTISSSLRMSILLDGSLGILRQRIIGLNFIPLASFPGYIKTPCTQADFLLTLFPPQILTPPFLFLHKVWWVQLCRGQSSIYTNIYVIISSFFLHRLESSPKAWSPVDIIPSNVNNW